MCTISRRVLEESGQHVIFLLLQRLLKMALGRTLFILGMSRRDWLSMAAVMASHLNYCLSSVMLVKVLNAPPPPDLTYLYSQKFWQNPRNSHY